MRFRILQETLRNVLWERIDSGELTGCRLAKQTGFKQAHISNFLNRKRGLSLEGMDKLLNSQHLSVLDLLDPAEVNKRISSVASSDDEFDIVPLVDIHVAAHEPQITAAHIRETLKFRKSFLKRLRQDVTLERSVWERFLVIKADVDRALSMHPRIPPGATLLLDRHYNSLTPYRKAVNNIYVVRKNSSYAISYLESDGCHLIIRPHNLEYPTNIVRIRRGQRFSNYIVGRICYMWVET